MRLQRYNVSVAVYAGSDPVHIVRSTATSSIHHIKSVIAVRVGDGDAMTSRDVSHGHGRGDSIIARRPIEFAAGFSFFECRANGGRDGSRNRFGLVNSGVKFRDELSNRAFLCGSRLNVSRLRPIEDGDGDLVFRLSIILPGMEEDVRQNVPTIAEELIRDGNSVCISDRGYRGGVTIVAKLYLIGSGQVKPNNMENLPIVVLP